MCIYNFMLYICVYIYICVCVCIYMCMYIFIYVYIYLYMHMYTYIYICMYECIYISVYIYVCVYIYIHTFSQLSFQFFNLIQKLEWKSLFKLKNNPSYRHGFHDPQKKKSLKSILQGPRIFSEKDHLYSDRSNERIIAVSEVKV